jgi:hypothetical protein
VTWLQAGWAYLKASLAPLRRFNAVTQEVGLPLFVVVIFLWLRANQGWARALVFALTILVVLLFIEGARREHAERVLVLDFSVANPELAPPNTDVVHPAWKVSIGVINRGADRLFIARCDGAIEGLAVDTPMANIPFG